MAACKTTVLTLRSIFTPTVLCRRPDGYCNLHFSRCLLPERSENCGSSCAGVVARTLSQRPQRVRFAAPRGSGRCFVVRTMLGVANGTVCADPRGVLTVWATEEPRYLLPASIKTDERVAAASPGAGCRAALAAGCGESDGFPASRSASAAVQVCRRCAGGLQHQLRESKCSAADVEQWCNPIQRFLSHLLLREVWRMC